MQSNNVRFWAVFFVAALVFVAFIGIVATPQATEAAPAPAPTPISAPSGDAAPQYKQFFSAQSMTADTTSSCVEVSSYDKADIYWNITIDGSNVNTSTVYLQHGNSDTALVDGIAVGAATAISATYLGQYQLFGGYACLKVDTTDASTGTVIITANALVK